MDLFSLIRALNPTKVKTGSRPRAPHEVLLLTLTAARVIEMEEPAAATDSSGVPSAIEKSPLDFAHEDRASDQGTTAPEVPPPEDVPATAALGVGQSEAAVAADPPVARESRKRGRDGIDATVPPKSLRRDHAGLQPSGSSHGGKSLAAMQLCIVSDVFVSEGAPADVSDPDLLSFVDAPSHHPVTVAQSSQGVAAARDPESKNVSSPAEVGSSGSVYRPEWGVTNGSLLDTPEACQDLVDHAAPPGGQAAAKIHCLGGSSGPKNPSPGVRNKKPRSTAGDRGMYEEGCRREECWVELRIGKNACPMLETSGRRWVTGHGLRLAMMKCAESLEMRQVFADVVSAGAAKVGGLEGCTYGCNNGRLILGERHWGDAPQFIRDLRPSSSQLAIPVYPEVRDPRNPWAYKEEIKLSDDIAENISRAEKKKKCRIVCRTHGVGSAHHARSDGVPVSVPTVVPQGLALLLVDAATQTDLEDALVL
nr:hypothetical protein [Tanacetum cinerariifolium]